MTTPELTPEQEAHAQERIADPADARVDYAAVAFAADHGADFAHFGDHVRLADAGPQPGAEHVAGGDRGGQERPGARLRLRAGVASGDG